MTYRFLEHTSDIMIEGEGKTFEEALQEVARGMITQMGSEGAKKKEKINVAIALPTAKEDIVVSTLSEIVATCESEPFLPAEVKIKIEKEIAIELIGERKTPKNIIKAVTYHALKIEREKNWRITVLFDI